MIPLVKPYIPEKTLLMPELERILYSGYIAEGEAVRSFEEKVCSFIENPYGLAVSSGTAALHLALLSAGVEHGDEVISTPMTAEPTNVSIAMTGANVVWGDIEPETGLLSPESVCAKITEKTKAIMLVHYAGMVCDMDRFLKISKEYNIPLIEDAAHALGSRYQGKYVGNFSSYTAFSFQAIKHMTTVDGGFLFVKNAELFEAARLRRWFGLDKTKNRLLNDITTVGYKYNMNNVNATIGLVQMRSLDFILSRHIQNGRYFDAELRDISGLKQVKYYPNTEASYWLYTMKVERREDFIRMMEKNGIAASPLHLRNDRHSIFSNAKCYLPGMEEFYMKLVHIPCGWWVTPEDREYIVQTIKKGW